MVLVVGTGSDPDGDDPGVSWLKVAIGVLFLVMAAGQWKKRPKRGPASPRRRAWMATIDTATPARAAVVGAALSAANPKNLALTLAAAAPMTGDRAALPLDAIKRFMSANNAVIMMVVLLLLGAKLLGDGLAVL